MWSHHGFRIQKPWLRQMSPTASFFSRYFSQKLSKKGRMRPWATTQLSSRHGVPCFHRVEWSVVCVIRPRVLLLLCCFVFCKGENVLLERNIHFMALSMVLHACQGYAMLRTPETCDPRPRVLGSCCERGAAAPRSQHDPLFRGRGHTPSMKQP